MNKLGATRCSPLGSFRTSLFLTGVEIRASGRRVDPLGHQGAQCHRADRVMTCPPTLRSATLAEALAELIGFNTWGPPAHLTDTDPDQKRESRRTGAQRPREPVRPSRTISPQPAPRERGR
jgi:hypothetical protein